MKILKFITTADLTIKLIEDHVVGFRDIAAPPPPAVRDADAPLPPSYASVVVWTSQGDCYQLNEVSTKKFLEHFSQYEVKDFT